MEKKLSKKEQVKILRQQIKDIDDQIKKSGVIGTFVYDWKEVDDNVLKDWKKTVQKLGGHFTFDPTCEGSDTYVFLVTRNKLDRNLLKKRLKLDEELFELGF